MNVTMTISYKDKTLPVRVVTYENYNRARVTAMDAFNFRFMELDGHFINIDEIAHIKIEKGEQ